MTDASLQSSPAEFRGRIPRQSRPTAPHPTPTYRAAPPRQARRGPELAATGTDQPTPGGVTWRLARWGARWGARWSARWGARWGAPIGLVAAGVLLGGATPAVAAPAVVIDPGPIGANQSFIGLVNGRSGVSRIAVTCDDPTGVVPTGHPLAGQTFKVSSVFTGSTELPGFTGSAAKSITAGFGTTAAAHFTFYEVSAAIPTTLVVPCSGTGAITFTPNPTSPTARAASVKVTFVTKS